MTGRSEVCPSDEAASRSWIFKTVCYGLRGVQINGQVGFSEFRFSLPACLTEKLIIKPRCRSQQKMMSQSSSIFVHVLYLYLSRELALPLSTAWVLPTFWGCHRPAKHPSSGSPEATMISSWNHEPKALSRKQDSSRVYVKRAQD
jgi:hypothetical protein